MADRYHANGMNIVSHRTCVHKDLRRISLLHSVGFLSECPAYTAGHIGFTNIAICVIIVRENVHGRGEAFSYVE